MLKVRDGQSGKKSQINLCSQQDTNMKSNALGRLTEKDTSR